MAAFCQIPIVIIIIQTAIELLVIKANFTFEFEHRYVITIRDCKDDKIYYTYN